jgi:very-short-patch-repair endonuclease
MFADGRETSSISTEPGHRWAKKRYGGGRGQRERALAAVAARQHGVVTLDQLRSVGLTSSAVRDRVSCERLHRLHRTVYALGRPDLRVEGRWMAAVLACGPGAFLSYFSAGALHRILPTARAAVDVTIARRVGLARPGIAVHRSVRLDPADRAEASGIPCTSVPRTLLDLAAVVNRRVLERACDQAEVLRLVDWAGMEGLLVRARGRPGVQRLRAVLGAADTDQALTRSELEGRFLALCRDAALPSPAVNQWLTVAGEEMQVDFVWRRPRLIVETDGIRTHGTRRAFQEDRRRDRLLALDGWRVIRFTWEDLTGDPQHVTSVLRDLVDTPAALR